MFFVDSLKFIVDQDENESGNPGRIFILELLLSSEEGFYRERGESRQGGSPLLRLLTDSSESEEDRPCEQEGKKEQFLINVKSAAKAKKNCLCPGGATSS